jgi:hypothetical protein
MLEQKREIPVNMTIVNMAGKIDQKYALSFMLSAEPHRKKWTEGWPENPEQNLERLAEAGFVMDRLVPLCDNCGGGFYPPSLFVEFDLLTND